MSGRGRGYRGRGNGRGRGRGRGRSSRNNTSGTAYKPTTKKTLTDFTYYIGSSKQSNDCQLTTEFIVNHIRKTFEHGNDIATSLETPRGDFDFDKVKPSLGISTEDPSKEKAKYDKETREFEMMYSQELKMFLSRKETYAKNKVKAYALIWERCSTAVQNKILAMKDYESDIKNQPIELLNAIEKFAMDYQENKYPVETILESIRIFLNTRQKETESLPDYTRRFRTNRDIMVTQIGGPMKFAKLEVEDKEYQNLLRMPNTDDAERRARLKVYDSITERVFETFSAYLYLVNADQDKYGSIPRKLSEEYAMGHDKYPTSIVAVANVLSNHSYDQAYKKRLERHKEEAKKRSQNDDDLNTDGQEEPIPGLAYLQCYCCGKNGHIASDCNKAKGPNAIPKDQWAVKKAMQAFQTAQNTGNASDAAENSVATQQANNQEPSTASGHQCAQFQLAPPATEETQTSAAMPRWMMVQVSQRQGNVAFSATQYHEMMKDWVLLDSESSIHLFSNKQLMDSVYPSKETLSLSSNNGHSLVNHKGILNQIGEIWFDERGMTNVLSLGLVQEKYRVTLDTEVENAFTVHAPWGPIKFWHHPELNLYYRDTKKHGTVLVETVKENKSFYTKSQVNRATRARQLLKTLGFPTTENLKAVIRMNTIMNCPVTLKDVDLAEAIFGPDVASAKGKSTRRRPSPVVENTVAIPKELYEIHEAVDLCIDAMFVNGHAFLSTVSKKIIYRTCSPTEPKLKDYRSALLEVLGIYDRASFKIGSISADREFKPLLERIQLEGYKFEMNIASAQEHVPEAERNNRVLKERIRAAFHSVPFKALPIPMLRNMCMEAARKLNFFPAAGGISKYFSPREILHQRKLDYTKQCLIPMFSYVLANEEDEPYNSLKSRRLECIFLRPADNIQGGHELMNLKTGRPITRHVAEVLPMPDAVIKQVEALATQQKQPMGLKITTKSGTVLYDSALTAGVEYTNPLNQNFDIEQEEYDDPNYFDDDYETYEHADEHNIDEIDPNELEDILNGPVQPEPSLVPQAHQLPQPGQGYYDVQTNEQPEQHVHVETVEEEEEEEEAYPDEEVAPDETNVQQEEMQEEGRRYPSRARKANVPMNVGTTAGVSYTQAGCPDPTSPDMKYNVAEAQVIATIMCIFNERMIQKQLVHGTQHVVTYSLQKGIKKFGERGRAAALKEMKQLHERDCFKPIHKAEMNDIEKTRALESLIFLTEKRDGTIKARHCANGSTQRQYMDREAVSSPTVSTESTLLTAVIDAHEGRDVATCDIPNAFIQTENVTDEDGNRTIMKIRGVLVDILCEMDPAYKPYVYIENGRSVLYMHVVKAIYGLLVSAMLFYKRLVADLTSYGFEINPYDPCVANKIVDGKQITVSWHVDDLKISHKDSRVVDSFIQWVKDTYGAIGEVKVTRGKVHDYLGMKLDYSINGQVSVDMRDYLMTMIEAFPEDLMTGARVASPWNENLFKVHEDSPILDKERAEQFHTTTAQGLFLCKRARPDISPAIAYLTTRVKNPNIDDWGKLVRMMKWLSQTRDNLLTLRADGKNKLRWYVDAAFAVHPDFRSHTGAVMTMGKGAIISISRKQGMNTRSSTESEIVAADEVVGSMVWSKLFLEAQGYPVEENVLFQDNLSAKLLEENGRKSAGKRSRHLNIRLFFVTDQRQKGNIIIEYCPTDQMTGDYMTKPLHGAKFTKFRQEIMNLPMAAQLFMLAVLFPSR